MTTTPKWVARLRSSLPKRWTVKESRGRMRLSVRSGAGGAEGQSVTLPFPWAADAVDDAIRLCVQLQADTSKGLDLREALRRQQSGADTATHGSSASEQRWLKMIDAFKAEMERDAGITEATWSDSYGRYLAAAAKVMGRPDAPTNARELGAELSEQWRDLPSARKKLAICLRRFLEHAIEVHHLPATSWTLSERMLTQIRGRQTERRVVATPTDVEILELIDSLPQTEAGERWRNALRLLALYGLRPEELRHLQARPHPTTGQPALWCDYRKACGQKRTDPRWLMPLPLRDRNGEFVQWNLAGALAIGQLELPPLKAKAGLIRLLERQTVWQKLSERYAERGEWLRPYSFRNAYSLRAHHAGHRLDVVCQAMGHSLAVHQSSYEWAAEDALLEHV